MKINFKSIRNLSENKINSFLLCEYGEPQQIVIVSLARWQPVDKKSNISKTVRDRKKVSMGIR